MASNQHDSDDDLQVIQVVTGTERPRTNPRQLRNNNVAIKSVSIRSALRSSVSASSVSKKASAVPLSQPISKRPRTTRSAVTTRKNSFAFSSDEDDVVPLPGPSSSLSKSRSHPAFTFSKSQPISSTHRRNIESQSSATFKTSADSEPYLAIVDRFPPHDASQLAVNPKKVDEVRSWMNERIKGSYCGNRTLLLTGPSGSGKTATIRVLAKELGLEVLDFTCEHDVSLKADFDSMKVSESSDVDAFRTFLRSIEYRSLDDELSSEDSFDDDICLSRSGRCARKPRVAIIEQLPQEFITNSRTFLDVIAPYVDSSKQFIIFIMPDVDSWELNQRRLFPREFLQEHEISVIDFNASATRFLTKALERVVKRLNVRGCSAAELKRVAEESDGDIRCALNAIGFSVDQQGKWIKGIHMSRNPHIDLFHMLGRLLYAKRLPKPNPQLVKLEHALSNESLRRPFASERDVNDVLDSAAISGEQASMFLSEHEAKFAPDLDSLVRFTEAISYCDSLMGNFFTRQTLAERDCDYFGQIAARTTMFYNYRPNGGKASNGKYMFTKSRFPGICREAESLKREVDQTFRSTQMDHNEMYNLTIPMINRLSGVELDAFQVRSVGYLARPMSFPCTLGREMWLQTLKNGQLGSGVKGKRLGPRGSQAFAAYVNKEESKEMEDNVMYEIEEDSD